MPAAAPRQPPARRQLAVVDDDAARDATALTTGAGSGGPSRATAPQGDVGGDGDGRGEAGRVHEPVWLVRIVILLFLVGFAGFLAREVDRLRQLWP